MERHGVLPPMTAYIEILSERLNIPAWSARRGASAFRDSMARMQEFVVSGSDELWAIEAEG